MKGSSFGVIYDITLLMVRLPLACLPHSFTFRSFVRSFAVFFLRSFARSFFVRSPFICSVRSLAVRSCSFAICSDLFAFVAARAFVHCSFFCRVRLPHSLAVYLFFFVRSPFIRSPFISSRSFMFIRRSFVFARCSSSCLFAARVCVCCSFIAALSCGRAV